MAFVVTSGQLQTVQRSPDYHFTGGGMAVNLSPTLTMTYGQLWKAQPALRTVTSFLARSVATLPLDPYLRLSDTDRAKAGDHPLARLLEVPISGTRWTKFRLLNTLMHDLAIFDVAYWLKLRAADGSPAVLPIRPTRITPRGGTFLEPSGFRVIGNSGHLDVPADRVVHFHGYNPDDPNAGHAPVETLRQILAEEHSASVYREQMWRNGARVAGYLARPKDAAKWSPEARERFKGDWRAQYSGDGPATGGTPILEDGMQFLPSAVTPRDAQYVEARKLTREEVAVAYHLAPAMFGVVDSSTIGSTKELHRMLYQDVLPPWLTQISQDIECQLLPDLDPVGADKGTVYVEFNLKAKLAGSFEEQAKAMQSAVGGPWMTRNEARAMHNLSDLDGGEELIVPLNVVAGGLASPNDTAPDNPDNGPSNGQLPKSGDLVATLRKFFKRQGRVALARLGAGLDPDKAIDLARWNVELADDTGGRVSADEINRRTVADLDELMQRVGTDGAAVTALFDSYADERAQTLAHEWETS